MSRETTVLQFDSILSPLKHIRLRVLILGPILRKHNVSGQIEMPDAHSCVVMAAGRRGETACTCRRNFMYRKAPFSPGLSEFDMTILSVKELDLSRISKCAVVHSVAFDVYDTPD